ncbi:MAG TPA: nucleotidyl transferase AbiEii/AbiGii toxin family protein [Candidatus Cloacimonetes bacterium]|nr:nucleotidyl transferase AbiEii/AbiGii toxin family protein [Candidatus Cloacimonadota bacterium]
MEIDYGEKPVSAELYSLIQLLMQDPLLEPFYLVGGTALALYLDHRKSMVIDLFIGEDFDSSKLASHFQKTYKAVQIAWEINTLRAFIGGIKVELISHQYPLLREIEVKDEIRLASLNDLAAFKLNAISGRGNRKDFWDLEALLRHFSLAQSKRYH